MLNLIVENWPLIAALAVAGLLAGLTAGLFGIGRRCCDCAGPFLSFHIARL